MISRNSNCELQINAIYDYLQIDFCARFWLIYWPDFAANWYTCTLQDDACLKLSIFLKLVLVVANYATYDFWQISWCTWIWLLYINPILLKIDIHVRYTMMLVWNNWFLWKHNWYLQSYATYDFCKYICVHGFDWSTDPILLKVEIVVRFTMLHVWNTWFLQNYTTGSCNIIKFIHGITIFNVIVKN